MDERNDLTQNKGYGIMFNYVKKRMKQGEALVKRASGDFSALLFPLGLGGFCVILGVVLRFRVRVFRVVMNALDSSLDSFGFDMLSVVVFFVICGLPSIWWVARNFGIVVMIPAFAFQCFLLAVDHIDSRVQQEYASILTDVFSVMFVLCFILFVVLSSKSIMLGLTNTRLIGRTRFGGKTLDCPLNEVVSVSVERGRGLIGRLGYMTICVKTASDTLLFNYIEDAENFKNAITAEIDKYKEAAGKQQEAA